MSFSEKNTDLKEFQKTVADGLLQRVVVFEDRLLFIYNCTGRRAKYR